ncbi:MAG: AAA family ATPase, partial [Bryobacteraceae bacterium]|nr:AAA family ATPase [Bryobacteraceae bacterium]
MPEAFQTTLPANPVYCHQEFLEKLSAHSRDNIGKRASLLLQRLAVDARRLHYKATYGPNRGWRRSRLGGNHGSHYYAWWATTAAPPIKESARFTAAPDGALFLRDLRHHDDHSPLDPQSFEEHYLPIGVPDIRGEEYGPAPWTPDQALFATGRASVRILKGHPGSGKTTALWHAADTAPGTRILYVTYSRDLAALAKEHFDRFCSAGKTFRVLPYATLVSQMGGAAEPSAAAREFRQQFSRDLHPFQRYLGVWQDQPAALYDEMHAHLVGDALPIAIGRFAACTQPRVPDKAYRERRTRFLGLQAASQVLEVASKLERDGASLAERYFPELALSWRLLLKLSEHTVPNAWYNFDCIAVDECQDLTPLETAVLVRLAARIREQKPQLTLLFAGDEAQTVRPTDFEWGWLSDLLHGQIATPQEYKLSTNLRSPRRIARAVNRAWDLYAHVEKQDRPGGAGYAAIEDDSPDQVLYCTAAQGPALHQLLESLASREGLAIITLDDAPPPYVPPAARSAVLTAREAKGLDFHSVCVLDLGRQLNFVTRGEDKQGAQLVDGLRRRLAIDQIRVAVSRPSDRLIVLDVDPAEKAVIATRRLLGSYGEDETTALIPEALLASLEEEQLDLEERIRRCEADSRQFLNVRPEIAWSRAHQAVTLLGRPGTPNSISDEDVRNSVHRNLARICFSLAIAGAKLPPELGNPNLFDDARTALSNAGLAPMRDVLAVIESVVTADPPDQLAPLAELARKLVEHRAALEPWFMAGIMPFVESWTGALEAGMFSATNAAQLNRILPPFYHALGMVDAAERIARLREKAIALQIKERQFAAALAILAELPERQPSLEAACHLGLEHWSAAAACYRQAGMLREALTCYREVPDIESALEVMAAMGAPNPDADSLEWIRRLRALLAERPDKLLKQTTPAERKLVEELL